MRKFKLIKEFPTSPPLGTILELKPNGWYEKEGHHSYPFQKNYVEDQPEFWEEIIPKKDYEILSFYTPEGDSILDKKSNGLFSYGDFKGCYSEDDLLSGDKSRMELEDYELFDYVIYSVKNLKNGLILTVGDAAQTIGSYPHKIQSFEIRQKCKGERRNGEWVKDGVDRIWINWTNASGGTWLEDAEKVEDKPLFTTLDGQELKHGDKFYVVDTKFFKIFEAEAGITFKTEKWIKNSYADKKLAENYILMNKPVLSLNDLLEAWCDNHSISTYKYSTLFQNFKKVAENKIKRHDLD